jgi:hypothetical protein
MELLWIDWKQQCWKDPSSDQLNNPLPLYLRPIFASIYDNPGNNERRPRVLPAH